MQSYFRQFLEKEFFNSHGIYRQLTIVAAVFPLAICELDSDLIPPRLKIRSVG
jgi:hypothetical protein